MPEINELESKITFPIGVVISRFNSEITERLLAGARIRLMERDFSPEQITVVHVPGAVEIPLAAQKLIQIGKCEAVIALGAVIRGDTDHYDYVCKMVADGCLTVSLQNDVPVIFGVLTTDTEDQALQRVGGSHGHKGRDAVDAAVESVAAFRKLNG